MNHHIFWDCCSTVNISHSCNPIINIRAVCWFWPLLSCILRLCQDYFFTLGFPSKHSHYTHTHTHAHTHTHTHTHNFPSCPAGYLSALLPPFFLCFSIFIPPSPLQSHFLSSSFLSYSSVTMPAYTNLDKLNTHTQHMHVYRQIQLCIPWVKADIIKKKSHKNRTKISLSYKT